MRRFLTRIFYHSSLIKPKVVITAPSPRALRKYALDVRTALIFKMGDAVANSPVLEIKMRCCDTGFCYKTVDDIPETDVLCPCGNYAIRYTDLRRRRKL